MTVVLDTGCMLLFADADEEQDARLQLDRQARESLLRRLLAYFSFARTNLAVQ